LFTTGVDIFTGDKGDDTFNATATKTANGLDAIDGKAGANDVLNVLDNSSAVNTLGMTVKDVETANFSSVASVTANTTKWTGLKALNVAYVVGDLDLSAADTTAVTVSDHIATTIAGVPGFNNNQPVPPQISQIKVAGGSSQTITSSSTNTNDITLSGAKGAVALTANLVGGVQGGNIDVTGGTTVSVTQNTSNAAATAGSVIVTGTSNTTSVSATHSQSVANATNNTVTINDANNGAASKASTIASVTAENYTILTVNSNALTSLTATTGSANINIDNRADTVVTKTLGLTLNGVTGGILDDRDIYTTLNVTTTGADSKLADITDTALTTLTVAGSKVLKLDSAAGMPALETVTVTGTAGLSAVVSQASVTAVDTSGTTGASTITLDAAKASFTGGAGKDTVTTSSKAPSKAIALGDGDDSLTLATGTTAVKGTMTGGNGTDTLTMVAADADIADTADKSAFAAKVSGFENLTLTGATGAQDVDLTALGGYSNISSAASGGTLTLSKALANTTLTVTGDTQGPGGYVVALKDATGSADVFNLVLTKAGLLAAGSVTVANVETVNITTADTQKQTTNPTDTLTLVAANATSVVVSGNAGLDLTGTANLALKSLDASGISKGDFTFTSGALTAAAAIKGSATGTNNIDFSASTKAVSYTGGTGKDTVIFASANSQDNTIALGAGDGIVFGAQASGKNTVTLASSKNVAVNNGPFGSSVTLGNGDNTITDTGSKGVNIVTGSGVDTITTGSGADFISSGGGNDVIVAGGGADEITAGAGADKITLSGAKTKLVMDNVGDSGTNTSTTIQTSQLTSTFDVVYGMVAGTTMQLKTPTPGLTATNNANLSGLDNTVVFARGTFDSAAGTFLYAANGADTAMTYDTTVGNGTAFETVILVGYVQGSTTNINIGVITFA